MTLIAYCLLRARYTENVESMPFRVFMEQNDNTVTILMVGPDRCHQFIQFSRVILRSATHVKV